MFPVILNWKVVGTDTLWQSKYSEYSEIDLSSILFGTFLML